jgi:hypothetical protein
MFSLFSLGHSTSEGNSARQEFLLNHQMRGQSPGVIIVPW